MRLRQGSKEQKTYEKEFGETKSVLIKLEQEIGQVEAEKLRLVEVCYQCFWIN